MRVAVSILLILWGLFLLSCGQKKPKDPLEEFRSLDPKDPKRVELARHIASQALSEAQTLDIKTMSLTQLREKILKIQTYTNALKGTLEGTQEIEETLEIKTRQALEDACERRDLNLLEKIERLSNLLKVDEERLHECIALSEFFIRYRQATAVSTGRETVSRFLEAASKLYENPKYSSIVERMTKKLLEKFCSEGRDDLLEVFEHYDAISFISEMKGRIHECLYYARFQKAYEGVKRPSPDRFTIAEFLESAAKLHILEKYRTTVEIALKDVIDGFCSSGDSNALRVIEERLNLGVLQPFREKVKECIALIEFERSLKELQDAVAHGTHDIHSKAGKFLSALRVLADIPGKREKALGELYRLISFIGSEVRKISSDVDSVDTVTFTELLRSLHELVDFLQEVDPDNYPEEKRKLQTLVKNSLKSLIKPIYCKVKTLSDLRTNKERVRKVKKIAEDLKAIHIDPNAKVMKTLDRLERCIDFVFSYIEKVKAKGALAYVAFVAKRGDNKPLGFKCSWLDDDLILSINGKKFSYNKGRCQTNKKGWHIMRYISGKIRIKPGRTYYVKATEEDPLHRDDFSSRFTVTVDDFVHLGYMKYKGYKRHTIAKPLSRDYLILLDVIL